MPYELDLRGYKPQCVYGLGDDFTGVSPSGDVISVNSSCMTINGKPFFAVSGELHYSRMDESRWEDEIIKLRMGGVNIVSTYLFWNHIEEDEGVFVFTGRRDLRRFVELCAKHGLYVILRVGPFAHGECRNGGLPDWLYGKPFEVRHTNPGFMDCVRRLYGQIGAQVKGLFYKDGGPVIGVQLDNEYMSSSARWETTTGISDEWIFGGDEGEKYLLELREIALASGLTPVFFTATAWGGAAYSPRILPLWGGYAYWPWIFYTRKGGEHPATPGYVYEDYHHDGRLYADDFRPAYEPSSRPYACCEMGGGMMTSYTYRFRLDYRSVDAMANIKIGSGCNFIGYYMYHGGTNPLGLHGGYLNESQVSKLSYDYQACLGEFGQVRDSYRRCKTLHFFTKYFGGRLMYMETVLPEGASSISPRDDKPLRYAVRTDGKSGFIFINNFQDHMDFGERACDSISLVLADETIDFRVKTGAGENAILPFNMDMDGILLKKALAQPVLRTVAGGKITYVFRRLEGEMPEFVFEEGVRLGMSNGVLTASKGGTSIRILSLSREMADNMYLLRNGGLVFTPEALLEDTDGSLWLETENTLNEVLTYPADLLNGSPAADCCGERGALGVYRLYAREMRIDAEVTPAAQHRWKIALDPHAFDGVKDVRLKIDYRGDIAALFLNGRMINDNFMNGDTWEIGLKEYRAELEKSELLLNITPVREGAAVNVDSPMAAQNETVAALTAELVCVKAQAVYEIGF